MERAYRNSIRALSAALALVGVAMVAGTLASGGGPLAVGVIIGLCFVAIGAGRLLLASGGARR